MMGLLGFLIGLTWWAMCMMIGRWMAGRFSFVSCVGVLALAWVVESCNFAIRSWTSHFLPMRWQRGFPGILEFMVIDIDDKGYDDHDDDLFFYGFNVHVWAKTQISTVELFWLCHIEVLASTSLVSRPLRMRISSFSFSSPFFAFLCRIIILPWGETQ